MKLFDKTNYTKWFITKEGKIYSKTSYQRETELKEKIPTKHKRGYSYVRTSNGNYQVHRLVAKSFIKNFKNKPCVNHIDGDKHNNHYRNLEWVTHKENTEHATKNGLFKQIGKNEGNIKYTNQTCKNVINLIKKGFTYKQAGEKYGMPYSTVAHLIRGSRRKI